MGDIFSICLRFKLCTIRLRGTYLHWLAYAWPTGWIRHPNLCLCATHLHLPTVPTNLRAPMHTSKDVVSSTSEDIPVLCINWSLLPKKRSLDPILFVLSLFLFTKLYLIHWLYWYRPNPPANRPKIDPGFTRKQTGPWNFTIDCKEIYLPFVFNDIFGKWIICHLSFNFGRRQFRCISTFWANLNKQSGLALWSVTKENKNKVNLYVASNICWSQPNKKPIHPGKSTWNPKMEVWEMIFLFDWAGDF